MRYHLYLVCELPAKTPEFIPVGTIENDVRSPALETQLKAEMLAGAGRALQSGVMPLGAPLMAQRGQSMGRKPKQILIRAIESEERANELPFRAGEIIEQGGMELSLLLGYTYNRSSQVLSIAARKQCEQAEKEPDKTERDLILAQVTEATLRGVTFCYLDELAKNDN